MDHALQEGAGGQHDARRAIGLSGCAEDTGDAARLDDEVFDSLGDDLEIWRRGKLGLHRLAVEPAVDLAAGSPHRRALGSVQHPELNAGDVRQPSHDTVQGVDFAHQMALAQAADGRIAAHLADGLEFVGQQQGARAEPRRRRRRLTAGVASANDDHVPGHTAADIGDQRSRVTRHRNPSRGRRSGQRKVTPPA